MMTTTPNVAKLVIAANVDGSPSVTMNGYRLRAKEIDDIFCTQLKTIAIFKYAFRWEITIDASVNNITRFVDSLGSSNVATLMHITGLDYTPLYTSSSLYTHLISNGFQQVNTRLFVRFRV